MKKIISTFLLLAICLAGFSQATYYWVGGVGPASFTSASNWNTMLDGSGDSRSIAGKMYTDVLIFDGANVGGASPVTGDVFVTTSSDTLARLIFQNNVNVQISRTSAGTANIAIQGDGTSADDLVIGTGSTVTLGEATYNYDVRLVLGLAGPPITVSTGLISGTLYLSPLSTTVHTSSFITSRTAGALVFAAGSNVYVTDSTTVSPFNGSIDKGILFKTGSSLHYFTGRSPFGSSAAIQFALFEKGSNFYVKGTNRSYIDGVTTYASSSWTNTKSFANIYLQNNASLIADGTIYRIDTLSINNGSTFTTHTSGHTPILGDLEVNGTFTFPPGSNTLLMGGNVPQTISGLGSIDIPNFVVADNSAVTLNRGVNATVSASIIGEINFGTSGQITGAGTFTSRVNGTPVAGTATTITAGSYQIAYPAPSGITGYSVTGAGIQAGTNVVGFGTSANTVYLSKPATATAGSVPVSFTTDTALLRTSNPNGFDKTSGSVVSTGDLSYQSGTKYIIDGATLSPFGISTDAGNSITIGDVIFNAPATTNYNFRVIGNFTLGSGILTVRPQDTARLVNGQTIGGAPFSNLKYVRTALLGTDVGVLRIDNFSSERLFPVGSATNYLPVNLTPTGLSDHAVSVFEGVTEDGTPTAAPFTATQKQDVVDAVWTINRPNGTGDCQVRLNWTSDLEGSSFSSFADNNIGISRYDGVMYLPATGTGDNTANTVFSNFSSFSPFIVTQKSVVLPVVLKNVAATIKAGGVEVSWQVANEDPFTRYEIEKRTDRTTFSTIGLVAGSNTEKYSFNDNSAASGIVYYRLKIISIDGSIKYSSIMVVRLSGKMIVQLYPNPAAELINFSGISPNTVIRISNSTGKLMMIHRTNATSESLNITSFAKGMYIAEVVTDGQRVATLTFNKQ